MKLIIFAGGVGTRLWPLSRRNAPKQFDKIFNGQSTIELAVKRVAPTFGIENIFIQTTPEFKDQVKAQIKDLPESNIFIEPERRNVAAAVCLATLKLKELNYSGPLAILWADHLMDHEDNFIIALKSAEQLINDDSERFVFMAEQPRFANNNLGWLQLGESQGEYFKFLGWQYKPEPAICETIFKSGNYFWNPGYFITSVNFLINKYQTLAPKIYQAVNSNNYQDSPAQSFDKAIIEKIDKSEAIVIKVNLGWSDPGTLYALKEALADKLEDNVTQGQVQNLNSQDCLVYNLENKKLVTTVGLKGMVIVNTTDALIVVPKDKVKEVTTLVAKLKDEGLEKYL